MDGTQVFWLNIIRGLQQNYDVTLYSIEIGNTLLAALQQINITPRTIRRDRYYQYLQNFRNQEGFDYIFLSTIRWGKFALLLNEMKIPYSWCIHEWWEPQKFELYMDPIFHLWFDTNATLEDVKDAYYKCDSLVFCANALFKNYQSFSHNKQPQVIHYGIDFSLINKIKESNRDQIRKNLGFNPDEVILLQVGSCYPTKGQKDSIEVFHRITQKFPNLKIKLVILGARFFNEFELQYIREIQQQVQELDLTDKVLILKSIPIALEYFYACDIKVLPSYKEIIPVVLFEAMAFEKPVITTNVGGIEELVINGETGLIVEPGNLDDYESKLESLIFDEKLRIEMGRKGLKVVQEKFTYQLMMQKYINLIEFHRQVTRHYRQPQLNLDSLRAQSKEFPLVSVVMPVYNNSKFLEASIQSVLEQSYRNFEFLILNDGSTEKEVSEILQKYKELDPRIRIFQHSSNRGIGPSVNTLISNCTGEFVSRMDSDDLIVSFRLEEEVRFLMGNKDVDIVGGELQFLFGDTLTTFKRYPSTHDEIKSKMLVESSMANATTMIRLAKIKDIRYQTCIFEDYDFWLRTLYGQQEAIYNIRFANIQKVFHYYRIHDKNTSRVGYDRGQEEVCNLKCEIYKRILFSEKDQSSQITPEIIKEFGFYASRYYERFQRPILTDKKIIASVSLLFQEILDYYKNIQEEQNLNIESVIKEYNGSYSKFQAMFDL